MPSKNIGRRPIEKIARKHYSWWGRSFVFIKRTEVKTQRSIFIIAFIAGSCAALIWTISNNILPYSSAATFGRQSVVSQDESETKNILQSINEYYKASPDEQERSLNNLINLSAKRKKRLLSLFATQPDLAFKVKMPKRVRDGLPEAVKSNLEEEITLDGEFQWLTSDNFENKASDNSYYLKLADGQEKRLYFSGNPPRLMSGSKLRIKGGLKIDDKIAVPALKDKGYEVLYSKPTGHTVKKIAVILFKFQDVASSEPYTLDHAREVIFTASTSVNSYYQEASFGNLQLTGKLRSDGDVFGWYTIPYNSDGCSILSNCTLAAREAAEAAGVDLTGYDNYIYGFQSNLFPGYSGVAFLGGNQSWFYTFTRSVIAHELGHNFGLYHANLPFCKDDLGQWVTISGNCANQEYYDQWDIMGKFSSHHMNSYEKGRLNWFLPSNTQTVTTSGTYQIAPIEYAATGVQSLRIPSDLYPGKYYYVEYRYPYGLDSDTSKYAPTVLVRLAPDYAVLDEGSLLLDATPNGGLFVGVMDEGFYPGMTFRDGNGVRVEVIATSTDYATVSVNLGCDPKPFTLATQNFYTKAVGEQASYAVSLKNNDPRYCPASNFRGVVSAPAGWSVTPAVFDTSLLPGQQSTTTLEIISPANISAGTPYPIGITLTNTQSGLSSSSTFNYILDNTPPSTPGNVTVNTWPVPPDTNLAIQWQLSADTISYIPGYSILDFNTPIGFSPGNSSYFIQLPVTNQDHCIQVVAADAAGNTATSTFTCTPGYPESLSLTQVSSDKIKLNWVNHSSASSNVTVARAQGPIIGPPPWKFSEIATLSATTTSYTDVGLAPNLAYSYRLRYSGVYGFSIYSKVATTTLTFATFDQWKQSRFTAEELSNPAISGETADPDNDGYTNLQEYAAATNPNQVNKASDILTYFIFRNPGDGKAYFSLKARHNIHATGINQNPAVAGSITGPWTYNYYSSTSTEPINGEAEWVIYRDSVAMDSVPFRFFKVEIETTSAPMLRAAAILGSSLPQVSYPLTVTKDGPGAIISASVSGTINCGETCSGWSLAGTSETLTAQPAQGYKLESWSGACSGASPTCTITMNAAQEVSAAFSRLITATDFHVESVSGTEVKLAWLAPANIAKDQVSYKVYRSLDNIKFTEIGSLRGTNFTDKGLRRATTYYYKLATFDRAGAVKLSESPAIMATTMSR